MNLKSSSKSGKENIIGYELLIQDRLEIFKNDTNAVSNVVYSYVQGLQWVLLYYYHGVPSWEWFYPYHYAPRISDLVKLETSRFEFDLGSPFFPFEQLMAVLPPLSKQHVPPSLQVRFY